MTTTELKNIAKENNLDFVFVNNTDNAICGFENFKQAEELAGEYNLNIVLIQAKQGSSNYEYKGSMTSAIDVFEQYKQNENFIFFTKGDAEEFQEYEINEILEWMKEDEASESEITKFLKDMNEVKAKIESLTDNEFIAKDIRNEHFTDVLTKEDVNFYNEENTVISRIALM